MNQASARITGLGIVSALGNGPTETLARLQSGQPALAPLNHFPTPSHDALPVGSVPLEIQTDDPLPRAHRLARTAADQAMGKSAAPPDAIVLGITTGGMDITEECLLAGNSRPEMLVRHSLSSVAEDLADRFHCNGPLLTISTACSSGAVAIKLALEMIRAGLARNVLTGGVDGLCRLTYYGFKSLQLLDPAGARPLDQDRRGMSVAEGAAMLLLESTENNQPGIAILGAGLSCDAYHPARPHPEGRGALAAMQAALSDAGLDRGRIDYINLHGTGTTDNDLAEARAIRNLFGDTHPPLSSVKGAMGHSLAAAGAAEAAIAAICIDNQILPGNTGCQVPDKALGIAPILEPQPQSLETVLSNSFGFGGNNAALVIGNPAAVNPKAGGSYVPRMRISGWSAFTGAGDLEATLDAVAESRPCRGRLAIETIARNLPLAQIRRLKRLPVMGLGLAERAGGQVGPGEKPGGIFFGTGLGCLSETSDFLDRLFSTSERFASPTDFVGSVHNATAGQIALHFEATGPNITTSGGDYSFEQALYAASLLKGHAATALVLAADEGHDGLSALLDPSIDQKGPLADGGGALWLSELADDSGPVIALRFFKSDLTDAAAQLSDLVDTLDRPQPIQNRYALVMAGMPAGIRPAAEKQLTTFLSLAGFNGPVVDYRLLVGEFQSASAVAAAMAAELIRRGTLPADLCSGYSRQIDQKGILILGLGKWLTAMEVMP